VAKLREQLGTAKGLNDAMWEGVVQKVIGQNDQANGDMDMVGGAERVRKRTKLTK